MKMTKKLMTDLRWCVRDDSGYELLPRDVKRVVSHIEDLEKRLEDEGPQVSCCMTNCNGLCGICKQKE